MAKREQIGSVVKSKDPDKMDYIKISKDVTLKKGDFLNLESKKSQLENLIKAVADSKLTEKQANEIRERIEKMPDFVRFEIVKINY